MLHYHSDHPGLVLVSKPLDGNNYASWCRAMSESLNAKNKLGFVNGTIKAPSRKTNRDDYASWTRCNDMVHSWILNTVTQDISDNVVYYVTAREVWEDLQGRLTPLVFLKFNERLHIIDKSSSRLLRIIPKLKTLWDE
ncbi:hypothetical protein ACLB2K_066313 [Fragaria x ananassa]